MRRTVLTFGLAIAVGALMGPADVVHATCDVPLVISHGSGDANVLIVLDNSGSMNEALTHASYNPSTSYSGSFSRTSTYSISKSANYTPRNFNSKWATTPSAYLVASDQGEPGDYRGNYLNWVYFNATATQRAEIPTVTRIQAAKLAVNTVLTNTTGSLFGLMIYNSSRSGTLLAPIGTPVATLQSTVNGIRASGFTPIAGTLVTALNYYATSGTSAPIVAACQKSFVVIVTDGLPTSDTNVPTYLQNYNRSADDCATCNKFMDNVTAYMYRNDLRPGR